MARCGCAGSSNALEQGSGISVTGTGTPNDPYVISFTGDQPDLTGVVRYDGDQGLSAAQKTVARGNSGSSPDLGFVTPEEFDLLAGTSGHDSTAAILSALAAGKHVVLSQKTYEISGLITLQVSQSLTGVGGMRVDAGSVLKCTTATAGVMVRGGGNRLSGITIDGNAVSTVGLQIGGTATGDAGADGDYDNLAVMSCAGTGIKIQGTQNSTMRAVRVQLCTNNMIVDWSVGGWLFAGIESNSASASNLKITQSTVHTGGYPGSSQNVWFQCRFEALTTDNPQVLVEGVSNTLSPLNNLFLYCAAAASVHAGWTAPLVKVTASGPTAFDHMVFFGNTSNPCLEVSRPAGATFFPSVYTYGMLDVGGATAGLFSLPDATALIHHYAESPQVTAGTLPLVKAGSVGTYLNFAKHAHVPLYDHGVAGQLIGQGAISGEAQPRFKDYIEGSRTQGDGTSAHDTGYGRSGPKTFGVTNRVAESIVSAALAADGAFTFDASLGSTFFGFLSNFNLTGFSITNPIVGQDVVVVLQMGSTLTTATLPNSASATPFIWTGGDAGVPVFDTVNQVVSFTLRYNTALARWYEVGAPRNRTKTQVFLASGTYTVPQGAQTVDVFGMGGGGGGGGGCGGAAASVRCGGGGGGGGGVLRGMIPVSDIGAPGTTVAVTVGAGGSAGTAGSSGAGGVGGAGGATSFGAFLATAVSGGAGGAGGVGVAGAAGALGIGNTYSGASGVASSATGAAPASGGTVNAYGSAGGGAGGGVTSGNAASAGGAAAAAMGTTFVNAAGGAATGAAGTAGTASTGHQGGSGGGGGGGNASGNGGNGGAGGLYGAGGGGGGGGTTVGGAGGAGASGLVIVTTYF